MGEKRKLKAEFAGDKEGKPPTRHRNSTPPPLRKGLRPPPGSRPRRFNQRCPGSAPGDARGEAPCIRKLRFSPFPPGRALCERGRGDGGKSY